MSNALTSILDLPSCRELSPYEPNNRVLWNFICSIGMEFTEKEKKEFYDTFRYSSSTAKFIEGMAKGLYNGCSEALNEYVKSTLELIKALVDKGTEFYEMVYDMELFTDMLKVYAAKPDSKGCSQALVNFAQRLEDSHPELASMFSTLAIVEPALRALTEWFSKKEAAFEVLNYLGTELGKILGEELSVIKRYLKEPEGLGKELGRIIGEAVAQATLFFLGV